MRYEKQREGVKGATQWYLIDLIAADKDNFSVVISFGLKDPLGEDAIILRLRPIFTGKFDEAMKVMLAKMQNRERVGYKVVEPEQENE